MAAVITQASPALMHFFQKTVSLNLQTHLKNTLSVKTADLLNTMTSCAFYPGEVITLY